MKRSMLGKSAGFLSSRRPLLWLSGGWVVYYVTSAVWTREAFAVFVGRLSENLLFQVLFVLFLLSAFSNLLREVATRYRKGKALCILWLFLPVGVFLFLLGFFISVVFREQAWIVAGQGDILRPRWQTVDFAVREIIPPIEEEMLDVESGSAVFRYEPKIILDTGSGLVEVGAFPPKKAGGTYYHILDFGLAPGLRLLREGNVMEEGYVLQRILPPGREDVFELPPLPYRFAIRIAPDRIMEKGRTRVKVYQLKSPSYNVAVSRGEETVYEGDSREGVIFDGYELEFTEPTYWVRIEAAKDPGLPVIVLGIALILPGIPFMFTVVIIRLTRGGRNTD